MNALRIVLAFVFCVWSSSATLADPNENEREGGILGTGIVGTITALGSIYVNGQHIRFDPDMAVPEGVSVAEASELLPGHTVAVVAHREGDQWRTAHIRQVAPLVGPLQKSPDGHLGVMGTRVRADNAITRDIAAGDWVAVSGLWQSGQVLATRIDRVSADNHARIEGTALDFQPDQPLRIGGTEVTGLLPIHIQDGDVVRVQGTPSAASIQVDQLETGVFAGTPQVVFSEGYFSVPTASGLYTLLGSGLFSFTDNPAMIDPSARQLVCSNNGKLFPTLADQVEATGIASILSECLSDADK